MTLEVIPSALEVGRAFAERYADADFELAAEEVIAEGRDFLAGYDGHATVLLEAHLDIEDDVIVKIDALCSGPQPKRWRGTEGAPSPFVKETGPVPF